MSRVKLASREAARSRAPPQDCVSMTTVLSRHIESHHLALGMEGPRQEQAERRQRRQVAPDATGQDLTADGEEEAGRQQGRADIRTVRAMPAMVPSPTLSRSPAIDKAARRRCIGPQGLEPWGGGPG